jgi:hypothetical protein
MELIFPIPRLFMIKKMKHEILTILREENALLFDFRVGFSYYARVILGGFFLQMFFNIIFCSFWLGHSSIPAIRGGMRRYFIL